MDLYLPFIITTKESAGDILSGRIAFKSAIPKDYGNHTDYLHKILASYPMDYIQKGLGHQVENGAIPLTS